MPRTYKSCKDYRTYRNYVGDEVDGGIDVIRDKKITKTKAVATRLKVWHRQVCFVQQSAWKICYEDWSQTVLIAQEESIADKNLSSVEIMAAHFSLWSFLILSCGQKLPG
jgi:hypothetical protein